MESLVDHLTTCKRVFKTQRNRKSIIAYCHKKSILEVDAGTEQVGRWVWRQVCWELSE